MKINEVFFQNSNLTGSLNDCSGIWLLVAFKDNKYIDALRVGFFLGSYEGIDYGIKSIKGDQDKVSIRLEILTKDGLYTYIDQSFRRRDFIHTINKLEMNISDRLIIKQINDNEINWILKDNSEEFIINLNLTMNLFHLFPSMIFPNNNINIIVAPHIKVSGNIYIKGETFKVEGIGEFDQYWSKKIASKSARKYGCSFYETIMWNEKFSSVLFYLLDECGDVYLQDLIFSYDGIDSILFNEVKINNIVYKNYFGIKNPISYEVLAKNTTLNLEINYVVNIINKPNIKKWGNPEKYLKVLSENMPFNLVSANGHVSNGIGDKVHIIKLEEGKGILEFLLNSFKI